MRFVALLLAAGITVSAELIDRIEIVIGREVITEVQLEQELRVAAFLNREPVAVSAQARKAAADRLVQQLLIEREMRIAHFPWPQDSEISKLLSDIEERLGESTFESSLAAYGLSRSILREHLALQLATLRFIELRFRPDFTITDSQVQSWRIAHEHDNSTERKSDDVTRERLVEEQMDAILETWLKENRRQLHVTYLDPGLK